MRRLLPFFLALGLSLPAASAAGVAPPCLGDCDDSGRVFVDEIVVAVRVTLGATPTSSCPILGDEPGEESIAAAVDAALEGCPLPPTATPTSTVTPTVTETPTVTLTPTITPTPPLSARVCGNGTVEAGEECDDHNRTGGDGCDADCRSEATPNRCTGVTPVAGTAIAAVRVAAGLNRPLYVTAPPNDLTRIFVVEQGGRIRIVQDGVVRPQPFLDISAKVVCCGELGLLGLAFHPHYASNGYFYVDYTTPTGDGRKTVVSRFTVSPADPNLADAASESIVLEQTQPFVAHKGGQLLFDRAGNLMISFGDGGLSPNVRNTAQDPASWLGKILRVDVDTGAPYAVPADNPFVGADGIFDEIWALGFRNPWRFSLDHATGDVYIGDVGDSSREEIDVVAPGNEGGNYGWCCREGDIPFARCFMSALTCPAEETLVSPDYVYDHDAGCSVTGGYVYRGCALPDLRGTYFFGDYCDGWVRSARYQDGAIGDVLDRTAELKPAGEITIDRISCFGEDGRGEIYICDIGGEVFRIVPAPTPPAN